ncbi:MAG: tRNA1(Val) (adenine(37)-N6)-methyltransferase [Parashewanella sp.]
MPFSFKQFHVDDTNCGMKVSTDAVILGAWARLSNASQILDIGAGSGILSLMAAQRSTASITAVELDSDACKTAKLNVLASPWSERIEIIQTCIESYADNNDHQFDHIICNPPYFQTGPQSQLQSRANARHNNTLTLETLLHCIQKLLSSNGRATLILPFEIEQNFLPALKLTKLTMSHQLVIFPVREKQARRTIIELSFNTDSVSKSKLCIREPDGNYSKQMVELTKDFYLKM